MTITKEFASKLAVAFVAVAMVFAAFASTAKAQTTEDLQQMINDLLAQVASLQSQLGQGAAPAAAGVCPYTWTRDLNSGATGMDVMKLQQFLNADPDTRVSVSGAGSAGMETEYYGPATAAAVSKFQVKYRSDILSPASLVNPTGYFGPSSRAKANALCVAAPVVEEPTTPDTSTPDTDTEEPMDDDEDTAPARLSGEASLDNVEVDSAEDDQLEEGAEDAAIAQITLEFSDGDAEVSRIDLSLVADAGNDEDEPWDVFESISLWVDGDKIAEENADDDDDYLSKSAGTLRFSRLDLIAMEDEELEIVVAATLQGNLDGVANDEAWDVQLEAIRFFDADGVATTETEGTGEESVLDGGTADFTIQEEGAEDELVVKSSSNDPDSATLQLEDDSDSDWYTVFVFDLDTDDSVNDIEINEIPVTVMSSAADVADLIDDAELVIDGVTIDDYSAAYSTTTNHADTVVLTFEVDGDVVIDAGDRVEAELMMQFNALDPADEGVTITAEVTSANADAIDAEGADDLSATQLQGAASGEAHTLRTAGIDVSSESVSASVTVQDGNTNDYGTYTVEVEVTAFEQDVFIAVDPAVSVVYELQDGAGSTSVAGSRSVTLTSTADEDGTGNYFEITEGSTETLTLTVTYTPGVANTAARMVLETINFSDAAQAPTQDQDTLPASEYRTSVITMVN